MALNDRAGRWLSLQGQQKQDVVVACPDMPDTLIHKGPELVCAIGRVQIERRCVDLLREHDGLTVSACPYIQKASMIGIQIKQ
jgi:hypothetical protein